mmetsp:Transcript_24318/g.43141  ORF Transcript_24318/g.43141 Transcript_24318/m.43141 type:complete len:268 (+) Transcript_24318:561-1364(+)
MILTITPSSQILANAALDASAAAAAAAVGSTVPLVPTVSAVEEAASSTFGFFSPLTAPLEAALVSPPSFLSLEPSTSIFTALSFSFIAFELSVVGSSLTFVSSSSFTQPFSFLTTTSTLLRALDFFDLALAFSFCFSNFSSSFPNCSKASLAIAAATCGLILDATTPSTARRGFVADLRNGIVFPFAWAALAGITPFTPKRRDLCSTYLSMRGSLRNCMSACSLFPDIWSATASKSSLKFLTASRSSNSVERLRSLALDVLAVSRVG